MSPLMSPPACRPGSPAREDAPRESDDPAPERGCENGVPEDGAAWERASEGGVPEDGARGGDDLADAAWRVEEASLALVEMTLNAVAEQSELSLTQLRVLLAVDRHGPLNLSTLAARLAMSISAAGRLVARLDAAGLVARLLAPHSRREISITVTPLGRRSLDELRAARRRDIAAALGILPPATRRTLADTLTELTAAAGAVTPGGDGRPLQA
ncbi:MarR family winged helix-turn-helix transcriptional regulator [Microbispora sp. ATCC PTA-5024]|uniref:MarR family winged helix-turn-helix transcriptional regulator n=1 Tax=Microbispora sp. ATCC PTA-5024 TaxID=316330 RepID=UPI0018DC58A0|nr:MarR family transcriptional regulator [Microbispora sp. ATCC PTA-5024]